MRLSVDILHELRLVQVDESGPSARFRVVPGAAKADLAVLAETNAIFGAHLELVQDPTLYDGVIDKIKDEKKNAELSLEETVDMFASIFADMDDAS